MERNSQERFLLEIFHIVGFLQEITRYDFLEDKSWKIAKQFYSINFSEVLKENSNQVFVLQITRYDFLEDF